MKQDTEEGTVVAKEEPDLFKFAVDERMKECSVCQLGLSERVINQLHAASKRKIMLTTQLAFLKDKYGFTGTEEDLTSHKNAHHERRLRELTK